MTIHIVLRNRLDCELDRKQVFHNQTIRQAMLEFVKDHDVEPGDKYEVVESDD